MYLWLIIIAIIALLVIIGWRTQNWSLCAIFLILVLIAGIVPATVLTFLPKGLNGQEVIAIVETKDSLSIFTGDGNELVLSRDEDIIWTHDSEMVQTKTNEWLHTKYTLPADKVIMRYNIVWVDGGEADH